MTAARSWGIRRANAARLGTRLLAASALLAAGGLLAQETTPTLGPPRGVVQTPDAWGTAGTTYVVIDSTELSPHSSAIGVGCIQSCQLRYALSTESQAFYAPVHLPAGVLVTYMEIDYYDGSAAGQVTATLGVCDPAGQSCVGVGGSCSSGGTVCSGIANAPGFYVTSADLTADGVVIDNSLNRYVIAAGNTTLDGSTAISQIILGYVRQVSPAPPSGSFADVPTSHPFFQFVEALVDSGITAGCGGSNYCPNAPLTRGQMAVFLAKALGLQWN